MQVHDELVLEVADEAVETIVGNYGPHDPGSGFTVPLKVDVGIGRNWDEAH